MNKKIPIKNHSHEIQLIVKRSMLGVILLCCLITLLIARLAYLQIYKHDTYTTQATKNWLDLVPVEPPRGLIYDRNGVLLAINIPVFSLDIIPVQVSNLTKTLASLKKLITLSDNDINQFKKQLKQRRRFEEIPLKLRLTEEEVARFTENQHRFPGVIIKGRLIRNYPFGENFSHVLGFVGRINAQELNDIDPINYSASHYIGKLGVEKYYEEELHGNVGYQEVENDASGKPIRILKEIKGTPGENIYLTLDSQLQLVAERALEGHRGAIVAIEPSTGQVLALVSQPSYDPNLFVLGMNRKEYETLQQSTEKPLFNRALRGLYPPASTIKPFLALAGLEGEYVKPNDTIYDPGWFQLSNRTRPYHDWWHRGHGRVNVSKAITTSCDVYFYELGLKMGIRPISNIMSQFGFGENTGIDLEEELQGLVATPEWKRTVKGARWYTGDTIISAIGQGFMQATPLQLAQATATLANRGKRFIPYLLLGEQRPGKSYVSQPPIPLDPITLQNPTYWELVIKAMQETIGTPQGTAFRHFGRQNIHRAAGKTGTAQVIAKRGNPNEVDDQTDLPEKLRDHHLFIAFAPADHPKIAIAIITENSNNVVQATRMIFDYYLGSKQNVRTTQIQDALRKTT